MTVSTIAPKSHKRTLVAYAQVANDLRAQIADGRLAPGNMIPSLRRLGALHGVSMGTVQQAVRELIDEGLLVSEDRRGIFVAKQGAAIDFLVENVKLPGHQSAVANTAGGFGRDGQFAPTTAVIGVMADLRAREPGVEDENRMLVTILGSIEAAVSSLGGTTRFVNTFLRTDEVRRPEEVLEELQECRFDAVIAYFNATHYQELYFANPGILKAINVLISATLDERPARIAYYDSADAGYQAARHLAARGCRRIVFHSPYNADWVDERLRGARNAAAAAGATFLDAVDDAPEQNELSVDSARKLFQQGLSFDGLIAANDLIAHAVIAAASEAGLAVGQDFALIGFDDHPKSRSLGLSTMRPPLEELGAEAAQLAFGSLSASLPSRVRLQSRVIVRASSCGSTLLSSSCS